MIAARRAVSNMFARNMPATGLFAVGAVAVGLAGCMVGPDFTRPDPPKDQSYLMPEAAIEQTVSANVLGGEAQTFVRGLDIPGHGGRCSSRVRSTT